MKNGPSYRQLVRNTLLALVLCAVMVTVSYFFVDRPVAFFVHDHQLASYPVLRWLTLPPPILQDWTPVVLAALMIRRAWGPFRQWELTLLAACVGMVLADQFRETLGYVFGRYWPDTWIDNNPSLIQNGTYGFHPFHSGRAYESFPSGHTTRTLALAAVIWIAYPKLRWVCLLASGAVVVGLLGMNYHFVSDVVAGGFVGSIVGTYTAHCCGLTGSPHSVGQIRDVHA